MRDLATAFAARGWPTLAIGVGVNTGPMNVGDMGSTFRKAYTVLGDAVNVTARLQDMTKSLECEVVISDEVRRVAGLPEDMLPSTDVAIRGRNEPMLVRTAVKASMLASVRS